MSQYSPKQIGEALDPTVKKLIGEILSIEKEYRHIGNLTKDHDRDICARIVSAIKEAAEK